MSKVQLECKHLKKYFNTPRGTLHAVDDISFTIGEGETLGIVGESGCGKSTLGRTILRLIPHTSGEVIFEGKNILNYSRSEMKGMRRKMQLIFQDPFASLNPCMTVYQAIAEALLIQKVYKSKAEIDEKVSELMDLVGLADRYVNVYPHELDGGRRQRIGIARALALNPKFIVCDEPVSALDVSIQAQILNLLMDLQSQYHFTYMFITHDLSVVKHISNDIAVMYLGKMVEKSPSGQLFSKPLHPYTQALLKAIPVPALGRKEKKIDIIQGEVVSPIDPKPGCRFAARCPYAMAQCTQKDPELREIEPGHFVSCHLFDTENRA